ncbi:MAG: glycosyltransferase family 2 protein [Vicingaceae bacterium]|jgi:glycosyltransferase involved in cell wall biosynthesis|nr:glycosyltransferase family 2 protein [Flavobacteriales bacterium]MBL1232903.1 glycosyltransferase family 2 protein [Flavobacteriales bacterium]MBQ20470.1 glycosyl transferase [Flavobacteriales bacterium]MDF1675146.1 glycosyltransferase family 2 protein [Vicingaceae bacterium]|tara:strand:- start:49949 stop:50866 length:918 start_codon:yes stop_codon:yes gene_type:complete
MISVLIPIYNYDVTHFVEILYQQGKAAGINFEIILMDDASSDNFRKTNQQWQTKPEISYIQLEQNVGRAKIRNLLAEKAQYDFLLFQDCDAEIAYSSYFENYIAQCQGNKVVCGGTIYKEEAPKDKSLMLRWKYGKEREEKPAEKRQQQPNAAFTTNNFLIPKKFFNTIKFDENLVKYGHEDTLFGYELSQQNIIIHHINNPLIHVGLESAAVFLQKTEEGIKNLIQIIQTKKPEKKFYQDVKLLSYFLIIKTYRLNWLFNLLYQLFYQKIYKHLKNNTNPSIKYFDLYKILLLNYYFNLSSKKR